MRKAYGGYLKYTVDVEWFFRKQTRCCEGYRDLQTAEDWLAD